MIAVYFGGKGMVFGRSHGAGLGSTHRWQSIFWPGWHLLNWDNPRVIICCAFFLCVIFQNELRNWYMLCYYIYFNSLEVCILSLELGNINGNSLNLQRHVAVCQESIWSHMINVKHQFYLQYRGGKEKFSSIKKPMVLY